VSLRYGLDGLLNAGAATLGRSDASTFAFVVLSIPRVILSVLIVGSAIGAGACGFGGTARGASRRAVGTGDDVISSSSAGAGVTGVIATPVTGFVVFALAPPGEVAGAAGKAAVVASAGVTTPLLLPLPLLLLSLAACAGAAVGAGGRHRS